MKYLILILSFTLFSSYISYTNENNGLPKTKMFKNNQYAQYFSVKAKRISSGVDFRNIIELRDGKLYKSTDKGKNWSKQIIVHYFNNIVEDRNNDGIYISTDNGITWNKLSNSNPDNIRIIAYPIPASDEVTLDLKSINNAPYEINMYNSYGQILLTLPGVPENTINLNISDLDYGVILLRIKDSDGILYSYHIFKDIN